MTSKIEVSTLLCWQEEGEDDFRTLTVPDEASEETNMTTDISITNMSTEVESKDDADVSARTIEKCSTESEKNNSEVSNGETRKDETTKVEDAEPTKPTTKYKVNRSFNAKIKIWKGDITRLNTDAVVNPTNSSLTARTAIMKVGGETLRDEAILKAEEEPDLTTGDTTAMRVYDETLPFRFVFA